MLDNVHTIEGSDGREVLIHNLKKEQGMEADMHVYREKVQVTSQPTHLTHFQC
jgi:hypothetical protein